MKALLVLWLPVTWLLLCIFILITWATIDSESVVAQPIVAGALTIAALALHFAVFRLGLGSFISMALFSYAAFHLFEIVPVQLGLIEPRFTSAASSGFPKAVALYILFLAGAEAGICVGSRWFQRPRIEPSRLSEAEPGSVWTTGWAMLFAGGVLLTTGVYQMGTSFFLSGNYGTAYEAMTNSDPRLLGTGMWAVPCALLILLASARTRQHIRYIFILSSIFFIVTNLAGFRGAGFTFAIAAFVISAKRKWIKSGLLVFALGVTVTLFIVPAIKSVRSLPLQQRLSLSNMAEGVESLWDGPREIGASFRMLVYSVGLTPGRYDFWFGRSYVMAAQHLVPNINPAWSSNYFDEDRDRRIGDWLTHVLEPGTYRAYGGMGSSGIAEPYINFGPAAVPVHFFLLFLLLSRIEWPRMRVITTLGLARGAIVLMPLCWTARDDVYSLARSAIWGLAVLWIGPAVVRRARQSKQVMSMHAMRRPPLGTRMIEAVPQTGLNGKDRQLIIVPTSSA